MEAKRVAFINGKGGCAKTTSVINLAGVLAKMGETVLVIDLDKQGNAGYTLLKNSVEPDRTVVDVMLGNAAPEEATGKAMWPGWGGRKPKYWGVDCMIASIDLEDETLLRSVDAGKFGENMDKFISERGYDWVFVDMPPSNKVLNEICFTRLVDYTIVPFSTDEYSVKGYGDILNVMEKARDINPLLTSVGVYLSRHNFQRGYAAYIREMSRDCLGDTFIDIPVPDCAEIPDSAYEGRPVVFYRPMSRASKAYEQIVCEMKKRINECRKAAV